MPEGLHRFCRLAAGGAHSLVVTERAEVLAWGSNSHGQVGNDSTEDGTAIAFGYTPRSCHLQIPNVSVKICQNGTHASPIASQMFVVKGPISCPTCWTPPCKWITLCGGMFCGVMGCNAEIMKPA